MSAQNDEPAALVLAVAGGIVALVLAGVITLALVTRNQRADVLAAPPAAARPEASGPVEQLFFAAGSEALPPDANELLLRVADVVRSNLGTSVLITAWHEPGGDANAAELARRRALAVRHALEADGVEPRLLVLARPQALAAAASAGQAGRVDVRVR